MQKKLKPRPFYFEKLKKLKDADVIKVLTGMRRTGKSSLLKMMMQDLKEEGIKEENIIDMNFSSLKYNEMNYNEVYKYILERYKGDRLYIFLDEIQEIEGWEKVVNSLKIDIDCDIYLTGSNAYLLAGEFATYLTGRYVILPVYPLSFLEYIEFLELELVKDLNVNGHAKYSFKDSSGRFISSEEILNQFLRFGSLPEVSTLYLDEEITERFLQAIYQSVFIRDIVTRINSQDANLQERIIHFLSGNIGNRTSINSIKNKLISSGFSKQKITHQKVQDYMEACVKAFLFYPVKRYDLRGKEELATLGKFYITDFGMRTIILQDRPGDRGYLLENLVYMELLKRGFNVQIGKKGNLEIDFIARKADKSFYIQVTQSLEDDSVYEREIAPLKRESGSYKRIIIAENTGINRRIDNGVQIISLMDFLLDPSYLD